MEIDAIIAALQEPPPFFPEAALRAAAEQGDGIADRLIEVIATTCREARAGNTPDGSAYIYAILLLAALEERRAFDVIADFVALPEEVLDELLGDLLTEELPRVLASVCGGRIESLGQIIEDRERGDYVRSAALSAIAALVQRGVIDRERALDYLCVLVRERLEREPSPVWDEAANVIIDLYGDDLFDDVRGAMREGLVADFAISDDEVDLAQAAGLDATMAQLQQNPHLFRVLDVVAATRSWACFNEDEHEGDEPEDEAGDFDLDACDDPHCTHHTAVPFQREAPKVGRNDLCPCGSGKKYKKCCL